MNENYEGFDTIRELHQLDVIRLFTFQKVQLNLLEHYIVNDCLYDKNDIFNVLQELQVINNVITKKFNSSSFKKKLNYEKL